MMKRASTLASSYRGTCISLAYDEPDIVDLALSIWSNIAMPSLLFGTECVKFSKQVLGNISTQQSRVAKFTWAFLPVLRMFRLKLYLVSNLSRNSSTHDS